MQLAPAAHKMLVVQGLVAFSIIASLLFCADADDASVLLSFKSNISDAEVLSTWSEGSLDNQGCPLNWIGVTCEDSRVTRVNLSALNLRGQVPPGTLGELSQLVSLNLSGNAFSGGIPDDLTTLPALEDLDLSYNVFSGPISVSFKLLQTLKTLSLAGNGLEGMIPTEIANLLQLQELDLSNNLLRGSIPSSITKLDKLVILNLASNELTGYLPNSFLGFSDLKTLDLHGNGLNGSVDDSLLALPSVERIDLSSNSLSGKFPERPFPDNLEYFNMSNNMFQGPLSSSPAVVIAANLKIFDVSNNMLTEPLPILKVDSAVVLRFHNNRFSGGVPVTSPLLEELDLSENQFSGKFGRVTSVTLKALNLSSNLLEGPLPPEFEGNCILVDLSNNSFSGGVSDLKNWGSTMETIDISWNKLNGSLPDDAPAALSALKSLDVSHNSLAGDIPLSFSNFSRLEDLDMSSNSLSGLIPAFLLNLSLTDLILSDNRFSGGINIPDFGSASMSPNSSVRILNLSMNQLNGPVPPTIEYLSNLSSLDLNHNSLNGSIPSNLSNLKYLHDLDLSYNQLTGPIPDELGLMLSLEALNLSYNNLSGTLPTSLQRFPLSSFAGNRLLRLPGDEAHGKSSGGSGKGSLSALEAGLIGGFTAAAVILIAAALFIYYRRVSRSQVLHGRRRHIKTSIHHPRTGAVQEIHSGSQLSPEGSSSAIVKPKGILKSQSYRSSAGLVEEGASKADGNGHQDAPAPVPYVQLQSQVQEEAVAPEQPVVLRVCSPERLAGDLFLLDTTLIFTAEELSRAPAEVLGRSSHGTSYKATLDSGHVLTVKWLREGLAKSRKKFIVEAKKFGYVKHQNVMSLRGYYWGPREHEKLLVSDFMPGGSLAGRLYERTGRRFAPLTWQQRHRIAVDIARGLSYLQVEHQWPHGNLKATNVLLDGPNLEGRLGDYSLHRLVTEAGTANTILNAGALGYRSSELASARKPKPSFEADVYALGVILMEILTGKGAGDIISGNSGAVDLPDWVRLLANEGRAVDCYDPALVGVHRDQEPPPGMDEMLQISLSCIAARSLRPSIKVVYEKLAAIVSVRTTTAE